MRRLWPSSHRSIRLSLLFLAFCEQITACVDVLFVIDNRTLEISRNRALQVARQLPEDQKIRKWVALSREDRYVPRVLRNNAELQSVLSTIHGDYDRFLEIATGEISRRTATFQPFVILLFSETPVNQTMSNMWRKISLAPALHIFRIGSQKKRQMLSEDQETDFEKLIQCGRNKTNPFDTESSKFSGSSNDIRRAPTSTHRPLTSTRDPFVRRLTFYDASRTLLEEKPMKKTSSASVNNKFTITRTFPKMTTKPMSSTRRSTTTARPRSTTTRRPTSSGGKFDAKKFPQRTTKSFTRTTSRPETLSKWTPTSRKPSIVTTGKPFSSRWTPAPATKSNRNSIKPAKLTFHNDRFTARKNDDEPKWLIKKHRTMTTSTPTTRKPPTTTTTRSTSRSTWTPSTRKNQNFPTWVFNTNRVTTRTLFTTSTRRPSTTTRSTTRWSPSTTTSPRWGTPSRTNFPSTTARPKPESTFWHTTHHLATTPVPPPASTIELPPQKKPENEGLEEFRGKNFRVRSRSVHFAMTEKPPVSSTMNMMRLFSTTRPSTTSQKPQVPFACTADVFFLVDLSQGTGDKSQQYLDIAASAISTLPISQEAVRVGLISYSGPGRTQVRVYLDKHSDKEKLIEEMFLMERHGGTTRTADAIRYATKIFEGMAHPARRNVKKVLVVFTDGYSQDNPKEAARVARAKGLQLIAVAVKDKLAPPDEDQLTDIGGHSTNVFVSPKGRELRERILGTQCRL